MVADVERADMNATADLAVRRVATREERRRLVREVYSVLVKSDAPVTYTAMHATVRRLQPVIERKFNVRLGYHFDTESFYGPIDQTLQEDLDVLDARGLVDNHDFEREGVISHALGPTRLGEELATSDAYIEGKTFLFGTTRKDLRARLQLEIRQ